MKQEYRFVRTSISGRTVDHIVRATKAIFEDDALVVEAENRGGDGSRAATYLRRDDAIDLAWSILEHYDVTERPPAPLAVGDYVKSVGGYVGRVLDIRDAFNGKVIEVQQPDARHLWKHEYCSRVTEQEFIDYHQQRITEVTNGKM